MSRRMPASLRPTKPASLTCEGTWVVTLRSMDDDWDLVITDTLGVYAGFVDDIAFTVHEGMREETILYFEPAPEGANLSKIVHINSIPAEPEFAAFDIFCGDYRMGQSTQDMRHFFEGRPVYARHSTWGNCGILTSTTTVEGAFGKEQADLVERVIAKLTPEELRALSRNGFKRFPESDYVRDYPRDEPLY